MKAGMKLFLFIFFYSCAITFAGAQTSAPDQNHEATAIIPAMVIVLLYLTAGVPLIAFAVRLLLKKLLSGPAAKLSLTTGGAYLGLLIGTFLIFFITSDNRFLLNTLLIVATIAGAVSSYLLTRFDKPRENT